MHIYIYILSICSYICCMFYIFFFLISGGTISGIGAVEKGVNDIRRLYVNYAIPCKYTHTYTCTYIYI